MLPDFAVEEFRNLDDDIQKAFETIESWPNFLPSIIQLNRTLKDISDSLKIIVMKLDSH